MSRPSLAEVAERLARGEGDALLRELDPASFADALAVRLPPQAELDARGCPLVAQGLAAGVGVATGALVLDARDAVTRGATEPVILVVRETTGEDVSAIRIAYALVEASGGLTSEGAVMARGVGLPCVVGATSLRLDPRAGKLVATSDTGPSPHGPGPREILAGSVVTVCGTTGRLVLGKADGAPGAGLAAVLALLAHADSRRTLRVVALARTQRERDAARQAGADDTTADAPTAAAPERPAQVVAAVMAAESAVVVPPARVALARLAAAKRATSI